MPPTTLRSRVFVNGNSQAVRIPQEFRLSASRVEITRTEAGELVIRPLAERRGQALLEALDDFDAEFIAAVERHRREADPLQDRESL